MDRRRICERLYLRHMIGLPRKTATRPFWIAVSVVAALGAALNAVDRLP